MKKVLDNDIVTDILDVNIYKDKQKNVLIITLFSLIKSGLLFILVNSFLVAFKLNTGLSTYIICPTIVIEISKDIYSHIKDNKTNFKLSRKKLKGKIEKINNNIDVKIKNLDNTAFVKENNINNKHKSIYIINYDKEVQILNQEKYMKDNKTIYKTSILDEEETEEFLNSCIVYKSNIRKTLLEKRNDSLIRPKLIKNIKQSLTIYLLTIIFSFSPSIKNSLTNYFFDDKRTDKIMEYFANEDSLSSSELDELIQHIHKQISKVTDNPKFDIDNIKTDEEIKNYLLLNAIDQNDSANKEEKEVLYNFIDFFNVNPYLEYNVVYENLENLEYWRNYNPFKNGIERENGTIMAAFYSNGTIYYCSTPNDELKRHEDTHAIFKTFNIPTAYVEGFAELIENEYREDNYNDYGAYDKNVAVTKATIELIGKDRFLEAMSTDNASIIKDDLIKLYTDNNSYITKKAATLHVNNFFKMLDSGLNDTENTMEVSNMLMSFFINTNYEFEKTLRLFEYANIIEEEKEDTNVYYYYNEEKIKTLVKD